MNYDEIINIKYPFNLMHKRMDKASRAAIFAPFAALSGHKETLMEVSRLTDKKIDIDDSLKDIINNKLNIINNNIKFYPMISITYFLKDKYKDGGEYLTIKDRVKKIDLYNKLVIMQDKTIIYMQDIIDIDLLTNKI